MKYKVIALESLAIFVSYLVFSLTLVSATNVNIIFNNQVQGTATYSQEDHVNMKISPKHEASDITWTNVKLTVNVNSASLGHSITKIFLYKCLSQTPTECARTTPEVFDNYIDTDLLWKDISQKTGTSQYPQAGNLLFIVKLEDQNGKENWVGFFTQTKRMSYNTFDTQQLSINSIEVYAKSLNLVEPIKAYIENKLMIPFKWATKVAFTDSTQLYAMGGSASEMDSHNLQTAIVSSSEIASLNKEFYFVSPKTSSGIANPILLNLNPSFACGDNKCESDIGESSDSCCLDCGCGIGQYCDVPADANLSQCRSGTPGISVISASSALISDCSRGFTGNISLRVSNPPSSITYPVTGTVTLNGTVYSVSCSGVAAALECSMPITSGIKCGEGSYVIGPGHINLTINYKDGKGSASKALSTAFSGVSVSYDCGCSEGNYCDTTKKSCQSESAITLGITNLTSYLDNYHSGDRLYLKAKIFNPPEGLVLVDKSATMNLTNGQVSPGTPDCSAPNSQFEYSCSIPFQISSYSNEKAYTFSPNNLYFTITYNDGPLAKTKTISAPFGPVSIPSQACGDSSCNMGESQSTCCLDCGCGDNTDLYCDKVSGCQSLNSIGISISSLYPTNFTDCREAHDANLEIAVNNAPTDMTLTYFTYMQGGLVKGWNLACDKSSVNMLKCTLAIPALESEGCSLPYKVIGPNSLNITISFYNGKSKQVTKQLSTAFGNIIITPVYHCGDGTCESDLGESASNCCYDCSCASSSSFTNHYCDYDMTTKLGGCIPKSNIKLIVDSPKAPVLLQSCELTNSVNIKAHIEGQPKDMRPQSYYATLNGSATQYISCSPEQAFYGANYTFNCTLLIPRISSCHIGNTYDYEPNNFSMLITFSNAAGANSVETRTLTGSIPQIQIYQNIRTLYDIMQDARSRATQRIMDLKNVIKDLMDSIKDCYEKVKMIMYMTFITAILVGYKSYQDTPAPTNTPGSTSGSINVFMSGQRGKVTAAAQDSALTLAAGSSFAQAWAKFCEFLQTEYQMAIKSLEIEQKLDSMQTCFEVQQHEMDIGHCDKQEQTCFTSMVNCINFNAISSIANDYKTIASAGSTVLGQMSSAFNQGATYAGQIGGSTITGAYGSLQVACNGMTSSECCGGYKESVQSGGTVTYPCRYSSVRLSISSSGSSTSCPSYIILDTTKAGTNIVSNSQTISGNMFLDDCHTYSLYCDLNRNGIKDGTDAFVGSVQMTFMKVDLTTCTCTKQPIECVSSTGLTANGAIMGCCNTSKTETKCESASQVACVGPNPTTVSSISSIFSPSTNQGIGILWEGGKECSNNVCVTKTTTATTTPTAATGCCIGYSDEVTIKGCTEALDKSSCEVLGGSYKGGNSKCTDSAYQSDYQSICKGVTSTPSITSTSPKAQMDLTVGGVKVTSATQNFASGQKLNFVCNALPSTSGDKYMLRLTVKTKLINANDYDSPLYDNSKEYTPNKDATPQLMYNYNDVNFDCNFGTRMVVGDCSIYKIPSATVTASTIENTDTKQLTCVGSNF